MKTEFVIALALAIPVIVFPAMLVCYLNFGGVCTAVRGARKGNKKTVVAGPA